MVFNDPNGHNIHPAPLMYLMDRNVGEMYTSAAPYDPLFWVVHPTSDRLLAWRRLLSRSGLPE